MGKNIFDKKFDMFERTITFDGNLIYSDVEHIKGQIVA